MYVHRTKHKRALVDFASSTVLLVYLKITLLWSHMGVSSSHCQMRGWWQWREEKESTNDGHMASSRTPLLLWLVSIPWSVVPWLRAAFFRPQPHAPPVENNTRRLNFPPFSIAWPSIFLFCLEHRERSFTFCTLCSKKKYYEKKKLKFNESIFINQREIKSLTVMQGWLVRRYSFKIFLRTYPVRRRSSLFEEETLCMIT